MPQKVISFGPKQFVQGLSPLQRSQTIGGFFASATAVDIYRNPGLITPGFKPVSSVSSITERIYSLGGFDGNNTYGLAAGKLLQISPPENIQLNSVSPFPHTLTGHTVSRGHSIINYGIQGINYLFYFEDNDIGRYDLSTTCVDNWGSTAPSAATALQSGVIHRAIVFNGRLYFTNGNYVGSLDGTTGATGTLADKQFTLQPGYTAKDIHVVSGRLEILTDNGVQVVNVIWDGISTLPDDNVYIDDNSGLASSLLNGFPFMLTHGRGAGLNVRQKNFYGYPSVSLISDSSGTAATLVFPQSLAISNNLLMMGNTNGQTATRGIYSYGTPFAQYSYREDNSEVFPECLQCPYRPTGAFVDAMTTLNGYLIVSSYDGLGFYLECFPSADSSALTITYDKNATFRTIFTDLPNDSTIDWISFFVTNPHANAAFTPILYTDYATSATQTFSNLTSATLDANGKSKTYYDIGALCDNFAIGGNWAADTTTTAQTSIIINRIDVGFTTK